MNLDFIWNLNDHLNTLGLYAESNVGNLTEKDSLAVTALPGGINQIFYDGLRDQDYNVQVSAKSKQQQNCIGALNAVMHELLTIDVLPSKNDTYTFDGFVVPSPPTFIFQDEQGWFVYQLSCTAKLTINRGVI